MSPLLQRKRGCRRFPPRVSWRYGDGAVLVNIAGALLLLLLALAAPAAASQPPRILAFGDSLTAGLGLPSEESIPSRLQARLAAAGIAAEVINGGVSGDTTAGGLARLDWALADRPDIVLLELGANDALRGIDPQVTYANLDKILTRLKARGVKILLIGMLAPANWGKEYQQEFDAIYRRLADKYQVPLYPFILDGVALDPALNQPDGLHPNAKGADLIAARLEPQVARLVTALEAKR
jgi:acyl-CoA thioesterase-1